MKIIDPQRVPRKIIIPSFCSFKLAAILDSLGRILLVDLDNFIIIKIWKGMRNCQISFLSIETNLFLVVYRKGGITDLFDVKTCRKAASASAPPGCRLVHVSGFVIGSGQVSPQESSILITPKNEILDIKIR